ncbi:hypothetical protein CI109_105805 [Kwoniella shandongensis]|uniref:Uncharacterized protein n=1 Tax=Kwoniella shandongensis TaxID=1734106 RepID=A0A5M6C474_9TREE|nr:uncharacterized protein CI109_003144 [Kwoniella shandongensis]KAA5528612.1 hypothetical protein CI109_003144 [Kwoniella shandongensis]
MRPLRSVEKQWLFTPSALQNTPSLDDGIVLSDELQRRKTAIEYMRSLALRSIHVSTGVEDAEASHLRGSMIIGATLLHRFYMRRSFKDFNEKLIAPTLLFLATKIEEEPLKLRHIVNACLAKFEPPGVRGWYPTGDPHDQPSREYRAWEKDILATEEVVLEALCFDMGVEQPWVILRRSLKGLDELVIERPGEGSGSNGASANGNGYDQMNGKGKGKVSEAIADELGWAILSESCLSPLPVLYAAPVLAFTAFILVLAFTEQIPLSIAFSITSELASRFHLDISFSEEGPQGEDVTQARDCLDRFVEYCQAGLIDPELGRYIVAEPPEGQTGPYTRRFALSGAKSEVVKEERSSATVNRSATSAEGGVIPLDAASKFGGASSAENVVMAVADEVKATGEPSTVVQI